MKLTKNTLFLRPIVACAAHKANNFKGSIYMVFDYMDHDMTGLMERVHYKFTVPQVGLRTYPPVHSISNYHACL